MSECDEDHCGVTMPVAVLPRRCHQRLDFMLGQVFARAKIAILRSLWHDCSFFGAWSDKFVTRLSHGIVLCADHCCKKGSFTNSHPRCVARGVAVLVLGCVAALRSTRINEFALAVHSTSVDLSGDQFRAEEGFASLQRRHSPADCQHRLTLPSGHNEQHIIFGYCHDIAASGRQGPPGGPWTGGAVAREGSPPLKYLGPKNPFWLSFILRHDYTTGESKLAENLRSTHGPPSAATRQKSSAIQSLLILPIGRR